MSRALGTITIFHNKEEVLVVLVLVAFDPLLFSACDLGTWTMDIKSPVLNSLVGGVPGSLVFFHKIWISLKAAGPGSWKHTARSLSISC